MADKKYFLKSIIYTLIIFVSMFLLFHICACAEEDWGEIVSVAPNNYDNYSDYMTFATTINFSLQSVEQGIVYLGFNTSQPNNGLGEGYSDEQLCDMARQYYQDNFCVTPEYVVVDHMESDIVVVHLFEYLDNHTATYDWYYINRYTAKGTNLFGEAIDLTGYGGAEVVQPAEDDDSNISTLPEDVLFTETSLQYRDDISLFAARLSDAAEDKDGTRIKELYQSEGYEDVFLGNYGGDLAYAIAYKAVRLNGDLAYILVITARGSQTLLEFWKDFTTSATKDFFGYNAYDVVYDFEEEIWSGLNLYLENHTFLYHENLKILITGHSLGGAAANLVAARFTRFVDGGAWWSDTLEKEDIYAYTFGAIDSIKADGSVADSFENIHNIYNFYDSFGTNEYGKGLPSGVGTIYAKFGHIDMFVKQYRTESLWKYDTVNHNMPSYIEAVENGRIHCSSDWIRVIVACPVDVSILRNGEVIGAIQNNEVVLESPEVPMVVIGESKYILFSQIKDYTLMISATNDGKMDYSVEYLSSGKDVKYEDIPLMKGEIMVAELSESPDKIRAPIAKDNEKFGLIIAVLLLVGMILITILSYRIITKRTFPDG